MRTRGEQEMPSAPRRQEFFYQDEIIGIIEDEQPAVGGCKPGGDSCDDSVLVLVLSLG